MTHICVIRDPSDSWRSRACFWTDALEPWKAPELASRRLKVHEVCLPEMIAAGQRLDFSWYDVVVFNWDVLNGDPIFASDLSQQIARYYASDLRQFVADGGLVVMECQARRWVPCQQAYDAIIGEVGLPRLRVSSTRAGLGFRVTPTWRFLFIHRDWHTVASPFVPDSLGDPILAEKTSTRHWFPSSAVPLEAWLQHQYSQERLYSGTFVGVNRRRWRPILYSEDGRHPVACVYHREGEGAYLVTTMYLASAGIAALLYRITVDWHRTRDELDRIRYWG